MTTAQVEEKIAEGDAARRDGRLHEAKAAFAEGVALCRADGDKRGLARALDGLGQIERDLGDNAAALPYYEERVAIRRELDSPKRLAHAVRHLADLLRTMGRLAEADGLYAEALAIYRQQPDAPLLELANTVRGYALLKGELGEREAALALWGEARELYRAGDVFPGVAESERQIGLLRA